MNRHSFVADSPAKYNGERTPFGEWLATEQGRYVLDWERAQFSSAVEDCFGYRAAQVGLPEFDFLRPGTAEGNQSNGVLRPDEEW